MKKKRNAKVYNALTQKMPDYLIKAGWFENSKYNDNTPIGGIAAVQNYGATINQSRAGNSWTIVIPPTHFMENCQTENKEKWKNMMENAWTSVFLGNISADKAMEQMGMLIEGDIAKQIAAVNTPPLAESTIQNRKNRYKDKKTTGNLTKRLVDTGQMLDSVSHQVTKL